MMMKLRKVIPVLLLVCLMLLAFPIAAYAADEAAAADAINSGDTTFVFLSAALVMLMTPGLAFFYGGMVRRKNVLNTIMNVFIILAVVSLQWVLFGYSLAFGPDKGSVIGGFEWAGLIGQVMNVNAAYAPTIPHGAFMMFQLMFAIITPALITGSFAERVRFPAFLAFVLLWSTLVYDPLAHWVWGVGGWLRTFGALDFAGGTVVHISSGIAGLVIALVIGKRKGYGVRPMIPHNLPMIVTGAALLWFGWFGFNAGSALSAGTLAINAFVVTNTSAAAATLAWLAMEWKISGKPTVLGAVSGAVVGLVAITPASGYVTPMASIIIGLVAGVVCYLAVAVMKHKLGYDDTLDAFGCHGIGGIWGAVATGIFATKSVNPAGADGLLYGNPGQLGIQVVTVLVTIAFSAIMTFAIVKVIGLFTKFRAVEDEESEGLDITQHGEDAYPDFYSDEGMTINI